jgi:Holliday junction resolvasome RuvABC endonuclease subunit
MIILALDCSTKSTGVAIFDGQELKHYSCITASGSDLFKRIHKMQDEIEKIIIEYKVDKIIMEDVLPEDVKGNRTVFDALKYLQGYLVEIFNKYKIPYEFMVVSHWRKMCGIKTGSGIKRESLKPKDIAFVKNQFGISVNDDIADAICIGFAAVGGTIKEPQIIVVDGFEFA